MAGFGISSTPPPGASDEALRAEGERRMNEAREHSARIAEQDRLAKLERLEAERQTHDRRPRPSVPAGDGAPYVRGSATSMEAAVRISATVKSDRQLILEALEIAPMTDQEISEALRMDPSTVRPRRGELARDRLIEPHGVGKTRAGRKATIWRIKAKQQSFEMASSAPVRKDVFG